MTLHSLTTAEQIVLEPFPKEREYIFSWIASGAAATNLYIRVGGGEADFAFSTYFGGSTRCKIPASTPVYAYTAANTITLAIYPLPMK